MINTTRLELSDESSAKFWQITVDGTTVTTAWGRLGTDGQAEVTTEPSPEAAAASAAKQVAAKEKKGYARVGVEVKTPKRTRPALDPTSDLAVLKEWWKRLSDDAFLALRPPTPSRYTQGHLHEDAAEEGVPKDGSYAGWHWQSHERSFTRDGRIISALHLHWGGDRDAVRAHLAQTPEGWTLSGGASDDRAFVLDRHNVLRADGMPEPSDPASVRHLLDRLDEPLDRRTPFFAYPDPTAAETAWLKEFITIHHELDAITGVVDHLTRRRLLTIAELDGFIERWLEVYAEQPLEWEGGASALTNMLAVDHPRAWEVVERAGAAADDVLTQFPSERTLDLVRRHALDGETPTYVPWLAVQQGLTGGDPVDAAVLLYADLATAGAPSSGVVRRLMHALDFEFSDESHAAPPFVSVASLRIATDERLPLDVRRAAAYAAADELPHARAQASGRSDRMGDIARRVAALFEDQKEVLMTGSGPDLTVYEGHLGDTIHLFRDLSDDQEAWLHTQIDDPHTGIQGLAYCLELLCGHGRGTAADVDALAPRWKKVLAKNYRTTYTEWRHPMVTLTAIARELDHPLRRDLEGWWQKTKAKWADGLRPMVVVGAPDEAGAAALWAHMEQNDFSGAHWRTWLLVRARLDGCRPVDVGVKILADSATRSRYQVGTAMTATVDPRQPLWRHQPSTSSVGWLDRSLEVAEDSTLPTDVRRSALRDATHNRMIAAENDTPRSAVNRVTYVHRVARCREVLGSTD